MQNIRVTQSPALLLYHDLLISMTCVFTCVLFISHTNLTSVSNMQSVDRLTPGAKDKDLFGCDVFKNS